MSIPDNSSKDNSELDAAHSSTIDPVKNNKADEVGQVDSRDNNLSTISDVSNENNTNKELNNDESNKSEVKPTKDSALKASLERLSNNGNIRLILFFGFFLFCIFAYAGYSVFFSDSDSTTTESGEFIVPKTRAKASATVNAEQAEYIKNQQSQAALDAAKNDGSYIASFVDQQNPTDIDSYGEATQPGANEQQEVGRTQFFDNQGRVYTIEQAATLSAQGKKIPGVTIGDGSINDPNSNSNSNSNIKTSNQLVSSNTASGTPKFESYVVQHYSGKSTGLSESATKQIESLNHSEQRAEQWSQDYLALRVKKAALIDTNVQLAFREQLTPLIENVKPKKDAKNGGGGYSRNHYTTNEIDSTNISATKPAAVVNPNQPSEAKVIARAGQTYRAILSAAVNTDEGTEVLAKILSGPMKGETILGSVKITEKNMQFVFTKILRKNKAELPISAVARQIGSNSLGMADEIKNHTLQRYSALVVSSALSGVGNAYEQTSGTSAVVENGVVVTNSTEPSGKRILGNAVGELGGELSGDIKNVSKRKPTYIATNGKVFNLFLNQDVVETSPNSSK